MEKLRAIFTVEQDRIPTRYVVLLALAAFAISLTLKLMMYYLQVAGNEEYIYNGNPVAIWTPDAGLYGFYAQEILRGVNYPFVAEYMPGYLLSWIHTLTGFSIEAILYWLPAFLTSFIVFPMMFMGWASRLVWGFLFASIITVSSLGYYERTFLGYYDPDNLNLFFMLAILSGLVAVASRGHHGWVIISVLSLIGFEYWYHSAKPLMAGIVVAYLVYSFVIDRKNIANYKAFVILAICLVGFDPLYKYGAIAFLYLLFFIPLKIHYLFVWGVFAIGGVFVYEYIDFNHYYSRAVDYFQKATHYVMGSSEGKLSFKATLDTVDEAQRLGIYTLGVKLLNIPYLFMLGGVGYFLLSFWRREVLVLIPLFALSIAAYYAGARFAYYAVPVYALGVFYILYVISKAYGVLRGKKSYLPLLISSGAVVFLTIALLVFSMSRPINQIFTSDTLAGFDKLKLESKKGDYIVGWWDYGWPLWHYTGLKTIIDGGIHHKDNYIVSKILLSDSQRFSANAARFIAEEQARLGPETIGKVFSKSSPKKVLEMLNSSSPELKKNRGVYIYLDKDMLTKVSTIHEFGNVDLSTGTQLGDFVYVDFTLRRQNGSIYEAKGVRSGANMRFDANSGQIKVNEQEAVVNSFYDVYSGYVKERSYNPEGKLYLIKYGKIMVVMDERLFDSFYIRAFVFGDVNKELFDIVYKNRDSMMLKVK
ncbi:MAG: STT3 domain-containing protein [Campylobacterales bacterium]